MSKKENLLRAQDSTIYKLQTDISNLQKELTTSRSYIITLESDKLDLEYSLSIHKQKLANELSQNDNYPSFKNSQNHNAASHCHQSAEQDSIKVWVLEQRIKTFTFDIIKQDNKMSNLQDMHIHHMYVTNIIMRNKGVEESAMVTTIITTILVEHINNLVVRFQIYLRKM